MLLLNLTQVYYTVISWQLSAELVFLSKILFSDYEIVKFLRKIDFDVNMSGEFDS